MPSEYPQICFSQQRKMLQTVKFLSSWPNRNYITVCKWPLYNPFLYPFSFSLKFQSVEVAISLTLDAKSFFWMILIKAYFLFTFLKLPSPGMEKVPKLPVAEFTRIPKAAKSTNKFQNPPTNFTRSWKMPSIIATHLPHFSVAGHLPGSRH